MPPFPVKRAETFYLPPPSMRPDAWRLVPPAELALRWYEEKQQRQLVRPQGVLLGRTVYARINCGRWVADCACGSAQVVTPVDPRMCCPECGAGWWPLTFPADVAAAEQAVAEQLPREQNWWNPADTHAWDRPAADQAAARKELTR